jgi:hypothetical protein
VGENIDTIQKNTKALLCASKEVGLEVNPEKTKYMLVLRCQVLVGKPEGKRSLGRPRRRWEDGIRMDLR